jgi:aminopeptidase N
VSRYVRILLAGALLVLAPACDGGPQGGPEEREASGLPDPYFPKAGNEGYDVTHYALDLAYDPGAHRLTGTAGITARATRRLGSFSLDLAGMDVESVTVGGEPARWSRTGQELTVRPPHGAEQGTSFRVTVRYSGKPRTITDPDGSREGWLRTADGALALGEPVGSMAWFPGNHHPSDKASYDIAMTVPKDLQAVSNGELVSRRAVAEGARITYRWRVAEPMASYLATVAVGRYDLHRGTTPKGLPLFSAVDPTEARASRAALARIPGILDWAEQRFGPYPFSSAGVVVDRTGDAGYALETQNRPVFPGAPSTSLLVHELAHQWYGDSVGPKTWRDMWLNEGFATYAEWLWSEDHGGDSAQKTFDALYHGTYFATAEENAAVWSFPPADPPDATQISATPVYQRGAMVLHKIRRTVGDAAFARILKGWAAAHRHGNADTADFTKYVEKQAPDKDFGGIWKDWLYGKGRPARP